MEEAAASILPAQKTDRPLDEALHRKAVEAIDELMIDAIRSGRIGRHATIADLCEIQRDLLAANANSAAEFDALEDGGAEAGAYDVVHGERRRRRRRGGGVNVGGGMIAAQGIGAPYFNDQTDVNRQLTMQIAQIGPALARQNEGSGRRNAAAEAEHLAATRKLLADQGADPERLRRIDAQIATALARVDAPDEPPAAPALPPVEGAAQNGVVAAPPLGMAGAA